MQPRIEELMQAQVVDESGTVHRLRALCGGRAVLLIFLRHFGCHGCHAQVATVAERLDELERSGVMTIFVGCGESRVIGAFIDRMALRGRALVVSDPSLRAHHAAALRRSWWGSAGPLALIDLIRLQAQGYQGTRLEGDPAQQGGALLLDEEREVVAHHASTRLGDLAAADELVEAALGLQARRLAQRDALV